MSSVNASRMRITAVLGWIALVGGIAILIYELLTGDGISLVGITVAGLGAIAISTRKDDHSG